MSDERILVYCRACHKTHAASKGEEECEGGHWEIEGTGTPWKAKGETRGDVLKANGWTLECESPLEIRHHDGSFAAGQAARMVIDMLSGESVD